MTKRQKRRLDATIDRADALLNALTAQRREQEEEKMPDLFTEIREALHGVSPIIKLRLAPNRYQVSQSFDAQTSAGLTNSHGEMLYSVTVSREGDDVRVRRYDHISGKYSHDHSDRTVSEHGEEVVRAFVLNFIREMIS